ncbi:rhodanese-like domain-containing protein [Sulfurospirillum sp. 1612]|uniref:rhodanese-like domain-containing protein n=1 Tax=Sulfurospirillum sp. 1612 TaxID=3094835 RepID=UPI002F934D1D
MDDIIKEVTPKNMKDIRVDVEEFITLYNEQKAELIDIRMETETQVWQVNFGLKIPAHELPNRLDELPKDKELVVACPHNDRSNMARFYLASKGFKVRYLTEGLLGLMSRLKGGKAKDIAVH